MSDKERCLSCEKMQQELRHADISIQFYKELYLAEKRHRTNVQKEYARIEAELWLAQKKSPPENPE